MAINTSGILKSPQGSAIQNAEIIFEQTRTSTEVLAGTKFSVITNQTGNYSSSLGVGTYVFKVRFQDETQYRTVASNVIVTQSMNNYSLNQIIQDQSQLQDVDYNLLQDVIQARDQAAASKQAAQSSQATASTKASEASSSAQAALASKNAAQTSEANALSSKNAAQTSQTNAASSQTAAANSQATSTTKATEASNSAQAALASKNAAQTSETNALASKNAAQASQTTASTKASEAATSQTAAGTKAGEAAASQTQAQQSQSDAGAAASQADNSAQQAQQSQASASTSQTTATTKASEASSSAQAALASKNAAQTSETNALSSKNAAQNSQTNAAGSQTAASTSQTTASTKAGEASTSQTNAAASQTTASTKAGEASTSQTNAAASQATATTKATEAANSTTLAQKWAANPENSVVSGGLYSALHYAAKAAQSAQTASGQLVWRGGWSAQAGVAPPAPTGSTQDFYRITQAGTILSVQYEIGDYIHWDTINSIWFKMDGTDSVVSVNGRTGAVVIAKADVGLSLVNNWGASSQTNDASTTTYATTAGVKAAYDLAATKLAATANAVSATKLVTARTINGTSFDGTANITTQNWGTARTLTIGNAAKSVNGDGNVSWSLSEIGAYHPGNTPSLGSDLGLQWQLPNPGGTSRYVRLVTLGLTDNDITFVLAGFGDHGTTKRATYNVTVATSVSGISVDVNALDVDWLYGAKPIIYHRRVGESFEVWVKTPYWNLDATFTRLSGRGGVVNIDSSTTTEPTGLTEVTINQIYTTRFKPTAGDVGAVSKTGDTMTGNLTAPAVLVSSTQNTSANALTRKDYVDSAIAAGDALQVSKTGDTMTGGLTFANAASELGWVFNTDYAKIGFKNTGDTDTDSYMWFKTGDNGNEYFKWQGVSGANTADWMSLKSTGLVVAAGVTAPTFTGALAGNAATATKLATARTINGTNFDGTGNITTANWGTARTLTIGNATKSVNGGADVAWSLAEIGAMPAAGGTLTGTLDQNMGGYGGSMTAAGGYAFLQGGKVGGDTADQKLRITGISATALTEFDIITAGHGVAKVNGARIYTEQYLPTPDVLGCVPQARTINSKPLTADITLSAADVGALGVTATAAKANLLGNTNLNTTSTAYIAPPSLNWWGDCGIGHSQMVNSGNGFTGTGYVFKIGARDMGNGHAWIGMTNYGDGGNLIFGANSSGSAAPVWATVYSTRNKPTAADVGAVNSAGDTMTGRLKVVRSGITGWPNSTPNDANCYANTAIVSHVVNNNGLHIFGDGNTNARRMGIQSAHADAGYTTSYGTLDLNPFGGAVRVNGHGVYHGGNKPTADDVGALPGGGTAVAATKLETARTIGGVSFDGTANINLPGVNTAGNQSTTGNAATATKLETARTISGVAFDGTANITLTAANVGALQTGETAVAATKLETARTIAGVSFDGTANISLTAANVGAAPSGYGLGTYGTGISTVLGDCNLRRQSGFFQGSNIAGIPNGARWTYLFNQAHGNTAGYFGYLAISFAGTQAWIGGQEGGTQKGPYELVKRGDSILTGRVEVNAGTNPMLEYHIPGKHAVCTYVDGAGNYRLATSNGSGGEVALRFQADTGGGLYVAGDGNFNDVNIRSDRRLKKNFVKISGALDKVSQLCAYTYDKKQSLSSNDYSTHEVGLIAQDVQLVLPEAVTEVVNPVDNLNVLTISNSGVNALLVEAIKELTDRVKYLESKIN